MSKYFILILLIVSLFLSACGQAGQNQAPITQPAVAPQTPEVAVTPTTEASQAATLQAGCTVISRSPTPGPTEVALIPPVSKADWKLGSPEAYITIIEYSDFQ